LAHALQGKLPVLGWNNYNAWHTDFDENLVLEQAQAIKDRGLQGLGYNYINSMNENGHRPHLQRLTNGIVDDNWQAWGRDGNGRLQPDRNRFPDGIDGLARKIHDMGFKFGIYGSTDPLSIREKAISDLLKLPALRPAWAIPQVLATRKLMLRPLQAGVLTVSSNSPSNAPLFELAFG
jgi:alpha-galactosidase